MDDDERRMARRMADAQQRLADAEKKLGELEGYRLDYERNFNRRATSGASGHALRDFQAFLVRLADAVNQQSLLVARARDDVAVETGLWQGAARRVRAIETVVTQWRGEERREQDRREQRDCDEQALQVLRRAMDRR
jgi:flagellar FliJ protein